MDLETISSSFKIGGVSGEFSTPGFILVIALP
jgi:hypothetical protein